MHCRSSLTCLVLLAGVTPAPAAAPFSCGGFALLGGAQLICSHTDPLAPAQICTYSWTLAGPTGSPNVAQGSFLLTPGLTNATVYQGSGAAYELSPPVVLCQGRKD